MYCLTPSTLQFCGFFWRGQVDGQYDSQTSHSEESLVLRLGSDRRVAVVGATIPRAIWTYVELQMDEISIKLYRAIHRECEPLLPSKGFDNDEHETSFINMSTHRRLCRTSMACYLFEAPRKKEKLTGPAR